MKKYFILMALVIISAIAVAQESATTVQREGNCFYTEQPAKSEKEKAQPKTTGFTTKDSKGIVRDVYQGSRGGLFYLDENNKKVYLKGKLKEDILAAMKERDTK